MSDDDLPDDGAPADEHAVPPLVQTLCHNCHGARYTVYTVYALVNGVGRSVQTSRPCPYCDHQGTLEGIVPPV